MEFEEINGIYKPIPLKFDPLSQQGGYCARYARKASLDLILGKSEDNEELWTPSNAWNFRYHNRTVWKKGQSPFKANKLRRGQILGIKMPFSIYNGRRDERNNPVQFTHLATYVKKQGVHYIVHNFGGEILADNLKAFLKNTESEVIAIFSPKDPIVLENSF